MRRLIIIEGPDRVGKDTLIHGLGEAAPTTVRHFGRPPHGLSDEAARAHQMQDFSAAIRDARKWVLEGGGPTREWPAESLVWNRGHLGEYVYGSLYRATKPEEWLFRLELLEGLPDLDPHLIVLVGDARVLADNDDGESFSGAAEMRALETELFMAAATRSNIRRNAIIPVTADGAYISPSRVLSHVTDFLRGDA